jgi:hypothetical protein
LVTDGFKATFANFIPFLVIFVICNLPSFLWELAETDFDPQPQTAYSETVSDAGLGYRFVQRLVSLLLGIVAQAALVYGTVQYLSGRIIPLGQCLAMGFSRLFPVLGVAIVTGIVIGIGFLCLIIPGLILMCVLYVAVPAAVMEGRGVGASLSRSAELTRGNRWPIFGAWIVMVAIATVAGMAIMLVFGSVSFFLGWLLAWGINILFNMVSAVINGVAYARLRESKEGLDMAKLAQVFD